MNIGSSNKSVSAKPTPFNLTGQKNLLSEDNPGDNGGFGSQPVASGGPQSPGGDSSWGGFGSGPAGNDPGTGTELAGPP